MIKYIGQISREKVNELYGKSRLGLVLYQPAKNHYESQPVKLFEYMAAGLPFVCSDFPIWCEIAEGCGICVNETDPDIVRSAIKLLLCDPQKAQEMGRNGRKKVLEKYNWDKEEKALLDLYNSLM